MKFEDLVRTELARSKVQHDHEFNSAHEAFGVLYEELDEFWDEVKLKKEKRNRQNMLKELVQIAAMAQKAAESLDLIPQYKES